MAKPKSGAVAGNSGRRIFRPANIFKPANLLPLVALLIFGTMLKNHIQSLDSAVLWQTLSTISLGQWLLAGMFTFLSFRAVGTYDVLVHRLLGTGVPPQIARRSGMSAIALSQVLGFGAVTSAFVRWRCLPDLKPALVARLSAVVSVSFLAALAVIGGLVIPMSGLMQVPTAWLLIGGLAIACLFVLSRLAFQQRWIPRSLSMPLLGSLLSATFLDTAFAAAALWVLWPEPSTFHLIFAAYLIALAAGLVSNCPGGIGAFDLTLLGLLQATDANAATAAILGFRIVYYIVPAVAALVGLLRTPQFRETPLPNHPEGTLAQQSANVFLVKNTPTLTLPCWGKGAIYGDFQNQKSLPQLPMYKCSAQQALMARNAGWSVVRCAEDALIDLKTWSLQGSKKRQLRRALNSFSTSTLRIRPVRPSDDLGLAAAAWEATHGREKGISMGRYDPDYLRQQAVFVALDGQTVVAFVSFHMAQDQWTLDLMRHIDDLPKGTMHALIVAAINAATLAGKSTLSLAAVPNPADGFPAAQWARSKSAGLRRFKSSFGPQWSARYLCARGPVSLALTMVTLGWSIHRPPPLPNLVQKNNEDYSIAPMTTTCEGIPSL